MSTTIKTGWLHDKNGDKFAPKTLTSQVQTSDGTLLEDMLQAQFDEANENKANKPIIIQGTLNEDNSFVIEDYETTEALFATAQNGSVELFFHYEGDANGRMLIATLSQMQPIGTLFTISDTGIQSSTVVINIQDSENGIVGEVVEVSSGSASQSFGSTPLTILSVNGVPDFPFENRPIRYADATLTKEVTLDEIDAALAEGREVVLLTASDAGYFYYGVFRCVPILARVLDKRIFQGWHWAEPIHDDLDPIFWTPASIVINDDGTTSGMLERWEGYVQTEDLDSFKEEIVSDVSAYVDEQVAQHEHSYMHYQTGLKYVSPGHGSVWRTVYGNGKFIATSENSNTYAYSEDGFHWTHLPVPVAGYKCWRIMYGNGRFVAIANVVYTGRYGSSDVVVYSEDGINWTETKLLNRRTWFTAAYVGGKFMAISQAGYGFGIEDVWSAAIAYSEDGITWNETAVETVLMCIDIAYGNGKFVATGASIGQTLYSEDGINWTQILNAISKPVLDVNLSSYYLPAVAYGNGKFVTVLCSDPDSVTHAYYSNDGLNWNKTTIPMLGSPGTSAYSIIYAEDKFVIVSDDGYGAYSYDGINWVALQIPSGYRFRALSYGAGKFIAFDFYDSSNIIYSYDGITWHDDYAAFVQDDEIITPEQIVNLPTEEDVLELLTEMDVVQPLFDTNGNIYIDTDNKIFVL